MALVVITGTSGAGKNSVVDGVLERHPDLWESVSMTTRAPRRGEVPGEDYHFVTDEEFDRVRDAGGFLEWFEVYGHRSGTPRAPLEEALERGDTAVLWLDVQGALAVREQLPEAVLVFVQAPSRAEQRRRLERRGDSPEVVERRLAEAEWEEAQAPRFDHVVVNDDLDRAVEEVSAIIEASRSTGA